MTTNTLKSKEAEVFAQAIEQYCASRPSDNVWLKDFRSSGKDAFELLGFPTPKHEEWKYTNIAPIIRSSFVFPTNSVESKVEGQALQPFFFDTGWNRITFVDGVYSPEYSNVAQESDLKIRRLAEELNTKSSDLREVLGKIVVPAFHSFSALNAAFLNDGVVIRIPDNSVIERPVRILYVSSGCQARAVFPRNLIIAGNGSRACIVESYIGLGDARHLTASVTEVKAASDCSLDYYRIQRENLASYHISVLGVTQEASSNVCITSVNLGGWLTRNDVNVLHTGKKCHTTLNGLSIVDGDRHVDNHTCVDHAQPDCESRELYKAIVDDRARSVFNGKIYVRPNAQRTDARQTNRNLLLSKNGTVDSKPQLEIFADDVKCTHGATIGQLNDNEIFYLRSRGMSLGVATQLLTYGFANDIVEKIKPKALREYLDNVQLSALHATSEFINLHDNISA